MQYFKNILKVRFEVVNTNISNNTNNSKVNVNTKIIMVMTHFISVICFSSW